MPTSMKNRPHGALFVAVEQIAFPKSFKVSFIFYNSYYNNLSRIKYQMNSIKYVRHHREQWAAVPWQLF